MPPPFVTNAFGRAPRCGGGRGLAVFVTNAFGRRGCGSLACAGRGQKVTIVLTALFVANAFVGASCSGMRSVIKDSSQA
ncbi:hypothetical protein GCM10022255_075690 [Dactylosporangium darangshiense]|uniref:Uncharacterized protein n=1 Tax=Dactylosporangium darangshiense TaxID=579108 RepID=A0ABP8DK30_9ACTN